MKKKLIVLIVLTCLIVLSACGGAEPAPTPSEYTGDELPDVTINTKYCDLVVTGDFAKNVKSVVTAKEPYTVSFRMVSDDTELFSIIFGGETENLLGTLIQKDGNIALYVAFNEFDSKDENYEIYCRYQENINTIIHHLISDYDFAVNEIINEEDSATYDIKTPVVTIQYPSKWKDKVTVAVTDNSVNFSCNGDKLFDLNFYECEGDILGTYNDTPIYIVGYTLDKSRYSEKELEELNIMQENVNVILEHLMEDPCFKISH